MSDAAVQTRLAKVVHVIDPDMAYAPIEVVINRGSVDGVKTGDRFLVFGDGPMISDPDTGKELGQLEVVRGRGEVVHVQEHIATIRSIERRRERPAKRVIRDATGHTFPLVAAALTGFPGTSLSRSGAVIEEELAAEVTIPFEHVRLGDQAKPI